MKKGERRGRGGEEQKAVFTIRMVFSFVTREGCWKRMPARGCKNTLKTGPKSRSVEIVSVCEKCVCVHIRSCVCKCAHETV